MLATPKDANFFMGVLRSDSDGCIEGSLASPKQGFLTTLLLVLIVSLLSCLYLLVVLDYEFFLAIGPGGTPSTPAGYAKICLLRLLARSKRGVLTPPPNHLDRAFRPYFSIPEALPQRSRSRPRSAGLAPHRQITQKGSAQDVLTLATAFKDLARKNPTVLQEGVSCFEKHNLGLFLTPSPADEALLAKEHHLPTKTRVSRRVTCGVPPEVAHMHGSEGSLHLTLHPQDAAAVIQRGWGERHPLAGRWLLSEFMMIYAPVGKEELKCVMDIVRAAAWWVGSVELEA
ncbi:MAG: hypothetical protein LQ340_001097 [Diploschistes diacapsis]|nr:MAG: hypothetical protein LQ340_001097 [Diploschistes diacapsis]